MGKLIIIAGIPGVGKTTVCNEVIKEAKGRGASIDVVNYGTVMLKILKEKYPKFDRDTIRSMPVKVQREVQRQAAKEIVVKAKMTQYLLVDTHTIIRTPEGFLPGLPLHVSMGLEPDLLVVVEAEPMEIINRRKTDTTRLRDEEAEEDINEEIGLSRIAAAACSIATGAPMKIVMNREGKAAEVGKEIFDICEAP